MAEHLKDKLLHGSDHSDTHASDSRWRHQEGHSYSHHAARDASISRDTSSIQPSTDGYEAESFLTRSDDDPAYKGKTARKHLSFSNDLADFLNDSRIAPPAGAKGKHVPIFVQGSHGEEFAEGLAARSSNGHLLQEEAAAFIGSGFGWEVRCGPLLNYRRMEDEVWHGSVLIVVKSADTGDKDKIPVLELRKARDGNIHHGNGATNGFSPSRPNTMRISEEFMTPRTTFSNFAGPFNDASHDESNGETKYEHTDNGRSPAVNSLGGQTLHAGFKDMSILESHSHEGGVKIEGTKLYSDPHNTFFRFDIQVPMLATEQKISYTIPELHFPIDVKKTGSQHFYVPAKTDSMRIMFHSCNGFSVGTDEDAWSGPALWNDVLRVHQKTPFHVMLGGGDQIYNDGIRVHGPLRKWTDVKNPIKRREYPFPESLRKECDEYYVNNYTRWYSTEPFASANGQIPQLNLWDDHDIIDGFGSYVSEFMQCPVFRGIGGVAYKYYMLFQHHLAPPRYTYTTDAPQTMGANGAGVDLCQSIDTFVYEEKSEDPSYIIGAKPGPYVAEHSRSIYTRLGARIGFFGIDARTERTRHQVNYPETYDLIFARLRKELGAAASSSTPIQHLIVLLGIPIAYPRLTWLENIFTSPIMGPIKFMNKRFGLAGGLFNHFDGSVDLLDDLDDHYTAKEHKKERHFLVEQFQALAAEFSVRISILGGDVHLAAVGRFYSNPKLGIPIGADHRYMANVISSAIVNKPPPGAIANLLANRNKIHHLDQETDETLLNLFDRDPGPTARTAGYNHVTMPSRNWAMITENSAGDVMLMSERASEAPSMHSGAFPGHRDPTVTPTNNSNMHLAVNGGSSIRPPTARTYSSSIGNKLRKSSLSTRTSRNRIRTSLNSRSNSVSRTASLNNSMFRDGHHPLHPGEEKAGSMHRAASETTHGIAGDGSLDVMIRVEVDQHDRQGKTFAYGLTIPMLRYSSSLAPLILKSDEVLVESKPNMAAPPPPPQVRSLTGVNGDTNGGRVSNGESYIPIDTYGNPPPAPNALDALGNRSSQIDNNTRDGLRSSIPGASIIAATTSTSTGTTGEATMTRRRSETTGTQTEKTQSTTNENATAQTDQRLYSLRKYSTHGTQTDDTHDSLRQEQEVVAAAAPEREREKEIKENGRQGVKPQQQQQHLFMMGTPTEEGSLSPTTP